MAQLSKSLEEVVDTLRPSPEEQQRQKEAFKRVRSVLLQQWSEAQVHLFGSTANCLSICNNNDIDVCLELPQVVQDQVTTCYACQLMSDTLVAVCICQSFCTDFKHPEEAAWLCFVFMHSLQSLPTVPAYKQSSIIMACIPVAVFDLTSSK